MFKVRIIPCLDVKDDQVVKGIQFRRHEIVGDILALATQYAEAGADELVFYDITASSDNRAINTEWIKKIAQYINIPFCVAGGIRDIKTAEAILAAGADKISLNSPALENPALIDELARRFGQQCVVVGIDSCAIQDKYYVYQYTGTETKTQNTGKETITWVKEIVTRGAGEIVLNCMNQDGMRQGYDIQHTAQIADLANIPVVASGGAGQVEHFKTLFQHTQATGALAASIFHKKLVDIQTLKNFLKQHHIPVRLC